MIFDLIAIGFCILSGLVLLICAIAPLLGDIE